MLHRSTKTSAFGVVNGARTCDIGGELPPIDEEDIVARDETGSPKVVVGRGRKKFKLELSCVPPTELVEAARRAARTANATFHHSVMPQHMADATNVVRNSPGDMPAAELVEMMGVTKPPALSVTQYEEMVKAWYWSLTTLNPELRKRCELTTATYRCFGWVLVTKLSGKSKS